MISELNQLRSTIFLPGVLSLELSCVMAEDTSSAEASEQSATTGSEVLHVPKAVFIEDVAAFLEGMF